MYVPHPSHGQRETQPASPLLVAIGTAQRHTFTIAIGTAGFAVVTSLIFIIWLSVLNARQREMARTVDRMAAVAQEARQMLGGLGGLLTPSDESAPGRTGGTTRRTSDQQDRGRGTVGRR